MPLKKEMSKSFHELSHWMLLCANRGRPNIDFLIEIAGELISFLECDALEIWLNEKSKCSRWGGTRNPRRLYRMTDVSTAALQSILEGGIVWTNDTGNTASVQSEKARTMVPDDVCSNGEYLSLACFPTTIGDDDTGLMVIKNRQRDFFCEETLTLCEDLSQILAIAVTFQRVRLAQKERVKELTCLYKIGKASSQPGDGIDIILQRIADCLPPAWQYPESTWARIVLDGKTYSTKENGGKRHSMRTDVLVGGKRRGVVEVIYGEEKPDIDEGPFLQEERKLIDLVALEVAVAIEQKETETDRSKLQEQLRHADRLATIGQLAAGVAHELNEPLGSSLGFAQLARKHPDLPAQVDEDLQRIEASSLHAREVIRKLMLFARQAPPAKTLVNLNRVVEDGIFFLEARCAKMDIKLECLLAPDLPEIVADPAQINQVLINLVVNSIQAMPSGGDLTIRTEKIGNDVSLFISDTGIGMSRDVLQKIFDPFFTTKDVGEGTGLGLAVVHGIVISHGGLIKFDSEIGRGTKCEVKLPITDSNDDAKEIK
jgi:signal transduction histidine kinase